MKILDELYNLKSGRIDMEGLKILREYLESGKLAEDIDSMQEKIDQEKAAISKLQKGDCFIKELSGGYEVICIYDIFNSLGEAPNYDCCSFSVIDGDLCYEEEVYKTAITISSKYSSFPKEKFGELERIYSETDGEVEKLWNKAVEKFNKICDGEVC